MPKYVLFFILGFAGCLLLSVTFLLVQLSDVVNDKVGKERQNVIYNKNEPALDIWGELYGGTLLPQDVFKSQIQIIKPGFFSPLPTPVALVRRSYSDPDTFIGALVLKDGKEWKKYLQIEQRDGGYDILDISFEFPNTNKQITHLTIKANNGAGSGEGDLMELVQDAPNTNTWHVVRCGYHAGDFLMLLDYTKGTNDEWYSEQFNKSTVDTDRIPADACNNPPRIILF